LTKRIENSGGSVIGRNKPRQHLPVGSRTTRAIVSRVQTGKCPETASGRHFWRVVTTKEDAERGEDRFICKKCHKEVVE
jgi:transposase-like protein